MTRAVLPVREVATLLSWRLADVQIAIETGVRLPQSGDLIHLAAIPIGDTYEIVEDHLDAFVAAFEREQPGRHPPVQVRRKLLVESGHRCTICAQVAPLHFHHIIEFSKLPHHDAAHMMAVCGVCHNRIGLGEIDVLSQRAYKARRQADDHEQAPRVSTLSPQSPTTLEPEFEELEKFPLTVIWRQCLRLPQLPNRLFILLHRCLHANSKKWTFWTAASYLCLLHEMEHRDRLSSSESESFSALIADALITTPVRAHTLTRLHSKLERATVDSLNLRIAGPDGRLVLTFIASEWWSDVPRTRTSPDPDKKLDTITMLWARGSPSERRFIVKCLPKAAKVKSTFATHDLRTTLLESRDQQWHKVPAVERSSRTAENIVKRLLAQGPCALEDVVNAFCTLGREDASRYVDCAKAIGEFFSFDTLNTIRQRRGQEYLRTLLASLARNRLVDPLSATQALCRLVALYGTSILLLEDGLLEALFYRNRAGTFTESILDGLVEALEFEEGSLFEAMILFEANEFMEHHEREEVAALLQRRNSRRASLILHVIRGEKTVTEVEALWNDDAHGKEGA